MGMGMSPGRASGKMACGSGRPRCFILLQRSHVHARAQAIYGIVLWGRDGPRENALILNPRRFAIRGGWRACDARGVLCLDRGGCAKGQFYLRQSIMPESLGQTLRLSTLGAPELKSARSSWRPILEHLNLNTSCAPRRSTRTAFSFPSATRAWETRWVRPG